MVYHLDEILLKIPLHELTFLTPIKNDCLTFSNIVTSLSFERLTEPTVLLINSSSDWHSLNDKDTVIKLIQETHLIAIIIFDEQQKHIHNQLLSKFGNFNIPIIQVSNPSSIKYFTSNEEGIYRYNNLNYELNGFYKRGFMDIAENISMAFNTPILFLDEHDLLLWKTGSDEEIKSWMLEESSGSNNKDNYSFEKFGIEIVGKQQLSLIISSNLLTWQRHIVDKFIGFTAVVLQTDEEIREQNDKFKEFFIYELIYRKFESKKVLINQGKTWGWNLEKPHHLIVVDLEKSGEIDFNYEITEEIVFHLEMEKSQVPKNIIIFPFQDHIIIMIEDSEHKSPHERKNTPTKVAEWILEQINATFPDYNINIGIGMWYEDTINLNKSYQEAKVAIQFGKLWNDNKQIYHMHDLGTLHLLTNIHQDLLTTFCEQYLLPLEISDENQGTEFLLTLKMYFQYEGNINDVSEAMFIHANTMRKRLRRIEELLGISFQNLTDTLTLMLAVKIYHSFNIVI